jgi:hypothetical protein
MIWDLVSEIRHLEAREDVGARAHIDEIERHAITQEEVERLTSEIAALKARLDAQTDKVALAEAVEGMIPGYGLARGLGSEWIGFGGALLDEFAGEVYADDPKSALDAFLKSMEA